MLLPTYHAEGLPYALLEAMAAGAVPVLTRIGALSERYGLKVMNVFHAGDGNLHPLILYDANRPGETTRSD